MNPYFANISLKETSDSCLDKYQLHGMNKNYSWDV